MSHYISAPAYYDRMPIDISFVFDKDAPAGKHGFLRADGDVFRFEDGTEGRFWGVIFNGAANFPEHDYSEKVANRLAQVGCNMVRLHQLDAQWAFPNLYQLSAGKRLSTTRDFCAESLERLDYLIYCLKQRGIYVCVDMLTYRKFKTEDGVAYAAQLSDAARFYCLFDPVMIDLQKEFCEKFWCHVNPYTGLAYRDDPVFAMCTIINENDLFKDPTKRKDFTHIEQYDQQFRSRFAQWLKENHIDYDYQSCNLFATDTPMIDFKIALTRGYYSQLVETLRNLGVRIPITGTNWLMADAMLEAGKDMDFTDNHRYIYDWHWGEQEKVCFNKCLTDTDSMIGSFAKSKIHRKPAFFSEWDIPWPNAYRAVGAPYFAAMSCLQNWSGMVVHTYSYRNDLQHIDSLGKEFSSSLVGDIPYREGIFAVWNDPAKFGLFYHSALMIRRQDVSPAKKVIGVTVSNPAGSVTTAQKTAMEFHQVHTLLPDTPRDGVDVVMADTEKYNRPIPKTTQSDTGELWRNFTRSIGAIDSPRTKAVYGFIGRGGSDQARRGELAIQLDGMTVDCSTDFGVIAVSSLTDDPISHSNNMLLSAIGRARNTGAQFDGEKMVDPGHGPIQAEVLHAEIALRTDRESLRVWAVNAEGSYVGMPKTTYTDGWLHFEIGDHAPALYYLIFEE